MPVSLKNQVALVVGASSGIGRAIAVALARSGARVMASARREDRLLFLMARPRSTAARSRSASCTASAQPKKSGA
ncbi:MAG: SDR family NAD(P)-dependent oxidoreductase [Bryobacteraceae bacterium]